MKPASFTYHRPRELHEALSLLDNYSDNVKVIAGGQSLVPMMNMRQVRPAHLVDINEIGGLSYIRKTADKLHIGALTRQAHLEQSALLKESCPILSDAIHRVGHLATRQRGTIGGSIAHADPAAEMPTVAALFNANLTIISSKGTRIIPACEFFVTSYTTNLLSSELLTDVEIPLMHPNDGWSYQEFARRIREFAMISAATIIGLDNGGKVSHIQMALGGAKSIPINVSTSLDGFRGEAPDEAWINEIVRTATTELSPKSDLHATAADRLAWLQLLVKKTLQESLQRAQIGGEVR
jgi:carbon-monoxide dehydrogenase medium subunit/2-furoyl-CoA dehydrogenase FAD binding subunit